MYRHLIHSHCKIISQCWNVSAYSHKPQDSIKMSEHNIHSYEYDSHWKHSSTETGSKSVLCQLPCPAPPWASLCYGGPGWGKRQTDTQALNHTHVHHNVLTMPRHENELLTVILFSKDFLTARECQMWHYWTICSQWSLTFVLSPPSWSRSLTPFTGFNWER